MPSEELRRQYLEMKKRQRKARMKKVLERGVKVPENMRDTSIDPLAHLVDAMRVHGSEDESAEA